MKILIVRAASPLSDVTLHRLAELAGQCPPRIAKDDVNHYRFSNIEDSDALRGYCRRLEADAKASNARFDWRIADAPLRLADFGLLGLDMDSTLITAEFVDELADLVGMRFRIAEITDLAMNGRIDYVESIRERVGLLAGIPESELVVAYDRHLAQGQSLSPGAKLLIDAARDAGLSVILLTSGFTYFAERLAADLKLDAFCSNELECVDGRLTGRILGGLDTIDGVKTRSDTVVDGYGKTDALERMRRRLGLAPCQTIAIGDGANDVPMLKSAGFSIAYHAKDHVKTFADALIDIGGLDDALAFFSD